MSGQPLSSSPMIKALTKRIDEIEVPTLPRFIVNLGLIAGHLVVAFSDGETLDLDLGSIGGGVIATIFNTDITSALDLAAVEGALAAFADIDGKSDVQTSEITAVDARVVALENAA